MSHSAATEDRASAASSARRGWLSWLAPAPAIAPISADPAVVQAEFRYWQQRILFSSLAGYALFYFVRKNLSVAMPYLEKDLGISKSDLGLFLTLHGVIYGLSKFCNGFIADRANARVLMALGLILSAAANVMFGLSSAVVVLGIVWMLNGWFQGIGFPPCARLMTHWFSPRELATKMSIWNTSHSIGAGMVVVVCGYLVAWHWRLCFLVPAAVGVFGAVFLLYALRDTPQSLGLPEVEGTASTSRSPGGADKEFRQFLWRHVFTNPFIWIVSAANFFVYTIRYAVLDWGPTMLKETKSMESVEAGWMVAAFEISGVVGMLVSGWITDRFFGGRGARTCLFSMLCAGLSLLAFWKAPAENALLNTALLCCAGFFIYGPQALVGIIAANLATKRAAATAVGVTGLFGYASTVVSGWGLGTLVQKEGWDAAFAGLLGVTTAGVLLFSAAWRAKASGYESAGVAAGR